MDKTREEFLNIFQATLRQDPLVGIAGLACVGITLPECEAALAQEALNLVMETRGGLDKKIQPLAEQAQITLSAYIEQLTQQK